MVQDRSLIVLYHIRDRLKEMRLGKINKDKGICYQVMKGSGQYYSTVSFTLRGYFREWHLYSGQIAYPVPCDKRGPAIAYDHYQYNLWDRRTKYGKRRYMLLEHIYRCVLKDIRGREKANGVKLRKGQ